MTNQPKKPLTKEQEDLLWQEHYEKLHKHYEEMNRRRKEQPSRYKRNQ